VITRLNPKCKQIRVLGALLPDPELEKMDDPVEERSDDMVGLLSKTREVIQIEKALTRTLEKVEPWLHDAKVNPHRKRVRPVPSCMKEAETILQVARSLSSRTSAPAGWTPVAPITNFATPNPLPNQLRGGALATLQLERAKKAESDKKKEHKKAEAQKNEESSARQQDATMTDAALPSRAAATGANTQQQRPAAPAYAQQRPKELVSMNLSDSSSEEEED
jgi:Vitamin-D-receptor interacting Mediator subunit 4